MEEAGGYWSLTSQFEQGGNQEENSSQSHQEIHSDDANFEAKQKLILATCDLSLCIEKGDNCKSGRVGEGTGRLRASWGKEDKS